jgi:hypothetical protein
MKEARMNVRYRVELSQTFLAFRRRQSVAAGNFTRDGVMKETDGHQLPFHEGTLPRDEDFLFLWK